MNDADEFDGPMYLKILGGFAALVTIPIWLPPLLLFAAFFVAGWVCMMLLGSLLPE